MVKKTKTQPRLTLHQLLGALSFWGSSVRILLVAFLVGIIFLLRLLYLDTQLDAEAISLIYILGSFVLLDVGYVMLAKAFPLRRRFDALVLLGVDFALAAAYILPHFVAAPGLTFVASWSILTVLLVLSVRGLLGLLFSSTKRS